MFDLLLGVFSHIRESIGERIAFVVPAIRGEEKLDDVVQRAVASEIVGDDVSFAEAFGVDVAGAVVVLSPVVGGGTLVSAVDAAADEAHPEIAVAGAERTGGDGNRGDAVAAERALVVIEAEAAFDVEGVAAEDDGAAGDVEEVGEAGVFGVADGVKADWADEAFFAVFVREWMVDAIKAVDVDEAGVCNAVVMITRNVVLFAIVETAMTVIKNII